MVQMILLPCHGWFDLKTVNTAFAFKFIHSLLLAAQLSTLSICSFVYACSRGREVSLHTITASSAYKIVSELTLFGRSFI